MSDKVITSPELEDGGKLWPMRGLPGGSGILPEDERKPLKLPPIVDLTKDLPKDGVVISPRRMADAIVEGRKTLVVKTKPFELAGERFVLLSERKALATVEFGEMHKVTLGELRRWEHEHLITEELRQQWCSEQKGWCDGPFYKWKVGVVRKFDKPLDTDVPTGPQVLVRDVEVKKVNDEAKRQGVMVALMLSRKTAEALAIDGGEEADTLHLTLAYLGKLNELPDDAAERAARAADKAVIESPPIKGTVSGFGRFSTGESSDGKDVLYASFDAPELAKMRERLVDALEAEGVPAKSEHGFTPHITLSYIDSDAPTPQLKVPRLQLTFRSIALVTGNELRERFPLRKARVELKPSTDPADLTTPDLLRAHWDLHLMHREKVRSQEAVAGFSLEDISNLHARVVDELHGREVKHPPPPDDGLDETSADFEQHASKQPRWFDEPARKIEKRYAYVCRSGDDLGREITLDEVLAKLDKGFKIAKPAVYLVGGLAVDGRTRGDIDILVKLPEDTSETTKHIIEFRLGRALGPELAQRMQVLYDGMHGPFTNHLELYDLTFERVNMTNEVKLMRDSSVDKQRAASPKLRAQAERAERSDKLTLGEFFHMPKPTRPAFPEQPQTVESFLALYREREEWLPAQIQKKHDGARHQVHRDGDKVTIISEDGDDNTDRLPATVEALKQLKAKRFVLDCEIERWDGAQHLPREAASGYLNSKDAPDDAGAGVVVNCFDLLYRDGDDLHKQPIEERLEKLGKLGFPQSTMAAPSPSHRLNLSPSLRADTVAQLEKLVRRIRKLPGSEGVVAKRVGSTYPLKLTTEDAWVKYHNATTVRGIVRGREQTKGGVWVYQWGVLAGEDKPKEAEKIGEWTIAPVGDTFATKLDFDKGDRILIEGETLNYTKGPDGVSVTVWVPRVIGSYTGKPDTVDAAVRRARDNLVLQQKEVDEQGRVEYVPIRKRLEKQQDPYLEIPPEGGTYRFGVQHHHRGKSLHADVRIELRPGKLLIGWTMNTLIAGSIKEPVVMLAQARSIARNRMDEVSKINWNTGEWAERPKRGTPKLVRATISCQRKAPEPHAWLNVEGKTKDPEPGKPPPIGGTRNFPGVFHVVESGTAEYGAQKPWVHEYFFHGEHFAYRVFFRLLRLATRTNKRELPELCCVCKSDPAAHVVWWADDPETVGDLCRGCVDKLAEITARGEAVCKRTVLPPSKAPEGKEFAESWFAIRPDDLEPNVLDRREVKKGWMPPLGISALPKAVRAQIPKELRYWEAKTAKRAKELRDQLVESIASKDVEMDFAAPYKKRVRKLSDLDARFVLQEQTWRGPIQVRTGPTTTVWWVRLDTGAKSLMTLKLLRDPLKNKRVAAELERSPRSAFGVRGDVPPGTALNPSKDTPSFIEQLDTGKASVLSASRDFVKVKLEGGKLKGLYELRRNIPGEEWLWRPSKPAPNTIEKLDAGEPGERHVRLTVPIIKRDDEQGIITGVVLEPEVRDAQGDIESKAVIARAAYKFLSRFGRPDGTRLGVMHKQFGDIGWDLIECWVQRGATVIGGEPVKDGSWLMSWRKTPDAKGEAAYARVRRRELTGFSIGGVAVVT